LSRIELIAEALVPSAYVLASVLDTSTATTVRLPIQNPALFARQRVRNYAERADYETLLTSCCNNH
jgi:hypothetical protein